MPGKKTIYIGKDEDRYGENKCKHYASLGPCER